MSERAADKPDIPQWFTRLMLAMCSAIGMWWASEISGTLHRAVEKLDRVGDSQARIETRMLRVDERETEHDGRLSDIDRRVRDIDNRVTTIEARQRR
jgi:hypothetical protein